MSIDSTSLVRALRNTFEGSMIAPGDGEWDVARRVFNLALDLRPALIAFPRDARDVAAAVRFAADNGLRVAPQVGGHNAGPLGDLSGSILLKTAEMNSFEVDAPNRHARAQAGVRWGPLVDVLSTEGLVALSGSARDVSVVPYSLGGGLGWLGRKHGLQANAVTAVELVTADGRQLRADHDTEPELFWAVRGGAANFGIVTAIEFELFPLPEMYGGSLFFGFERASEVVHAWREWGPALPDEVSTTMKLVRFPPLPTIPEPMRGNSYAAVQAGVIGDAAFCDEIVAPLRALGPEIDIFQRLEPGDLSHIAMDPEQPMPLLGDGRLFGNIPPEGFDRLVENAGPGSGTELQVAEMRLLGGALGRSHEGHGAVDKLDGTYTAYLAGTIADPAKADAVLARINRVYGAMKEYESGRYLNFAELSSEPEQFFGAERTARLRRLREQWDPQRLLHANHQL
ncbi:MAG TPA: FAD-binding oxidoreductase [Conexibacter sp.]|jgi:FAD/FMN-containing dehydrogenase